MFVILFPVSGKLHLCFLLQLSCCGRHRSDISGFNFLKQLYVVV